MVNELNDPRIYLITNYNSDSVVAFDQSRQGRNPHTRSFTKSVGRESGIATDHRDRRTDVSPFRVEGIDKCDTDGPVPVFTFYKDQRSRTGWLRANDHVKVAAPVRAVRPCSY